MINEIQKLVRENPGQLSREEYLEVAKVVLMNKPCNLLIFELIIIPVESLILKILIYIFYDYMRCKGLAPRLASP